MDGLPPLSARVHAVSRRDHGLALRSGGNRCAAGETGEHVNFSVAAETNFNTCETVTTKSMLRQAVAQDDIKSHSFGG